ncbi:MAG: lytic transglycosylase domain-containing protein [Terriglobales bacterium]
MLAGLLQIPATFPRASARLYVSSAHPSPRNLANESRPRDAAAIAHAEAVLRATASHRASARERALASFALGKGEAERNQTSAAASDLTTAAKWEPVRDAATAELVRMWASAGDASQTLAAADQWPPAKGDVFGSAIGKPAARAAVKLQAWKEARQWALRFPNDPEMLWALAQAEDGLGDGRAAAEAERRIFYRYPASPAAKDAGPAFLRHLAALPQLEPTWRQEMERAEGWEAAGRYRKAAGRFARAARMAPRSERARLEAREARSWLHAGDGEHARTRLRTLLHSSQRAQALEIEVELARHRGQPGDMDGPLASLRHEFSHSRWRAVALRQAGDEATLQFDDAAAQKRFDELAHAFPHSPYAAKAAWRAAWIAFRLGQSDTPQRIERYLRTYPHGAAVTDAIFWRGVWAERHQNAELAQACFETADRYFPGTFFGQQAQRRVQPAATATADRAAPDWLARFQHHRPAPAAAPIAARFQPDVERARWMAAAGLLDPAAAILNHVLYDLPRRAASLALAREVGKIEGERQTWNLGMTAMIRAVPHYMELQPAQLRRGDWTLLFPAPYPDDIAATVRVYGLNRYLVLGLIRQESGFNTTAVSYANARGLMQLELGTARHRLRTLPASWQRLKGPGRLSASDLLKPGLNLALGTAELSHLLQEFDEPAYALAGYNAGGNRVTQWKQQFAGLALDAFIESVPFTQTRNYIQAVLRNAEHYREIYDSRHR